MIRRRLLRLAMRQRATQDRDDRGYVLVFLCISLIVLLLFAAFTVDIGRWYSRSNQVQRAADAAALAGVPYLPNFDAAKAAAIDAAKLNGFVNDPANPDSPTVIVERGDTPRRLKVTIGDPKVPTTFGKIVMDSISIARSSLAEYVGSIPLGSPYNALGTGSLDPTNGGVRYDGTAASPAKQNFWLAVNGYCTAKEDGDLKLSRYDGNHPNAGIDSSDVYVCNNTSVAGTNDNKDYTTTGGLPDGYEYIIDVPCAGRSDPSIPCDPTLPAPNGGVQLQVYNPVLDTGSEFLPTPGLDRVNLNFGISSLNAAPAAGSIDERIMNVRVNTTFKLYSPDPTDPNKWNAVPPASGGQVVFGTCNSINGGVPGYNWPASNCSGNDVWQNLFPLITTAGRWKVQVFTEQSESNSFGTNVFALRAFTGAGFGSAICDGRVSPDTCPGISGNSAMSIKVDANVDTALMWLSRLAPAAEFRGKQIHVKLWDPGELMQSIEILDPSGTPVTFRYDLIDPGLLSGATTVQETASGPGASGTTNLLDVHGRGAGFIPTPWAWGPRFSDYKYNDRYVRLTISIPSNYGLQPDGITETPGFDGWWRIRYIKSPGATAVNDRTTWTVGLVGDPVHLIRQ